MHMQDVCNAYILEPKVGEMKETRKNTCHKTRHYPCVFIVFYNLEGSFHIPLTVEGSIFGSRIQNLARIGITQSNFSQP